MWIYASQAKFKSCFIPLCSREEVHHRRLEVDITLCCLGLSESSNLDTLEFWLYNGSDISSHAFPWKKIHSGICRQFYHCRHETWRTDTQTTSRLLLVARKTSFVERTWAYIIIRLCGCLKKIRACGNISPHMQPMFERPVSLQFLWLHSFINS